jgi:DNA mismatch repair protein PMS2
MKHATSKIRSFDEIYADKQCDNGQMQLQQLGFRGEALFSLANISQNLVISSRAENESIGQKMEFRRDGYPDTNATTDVARKVGTTVAVVKVFDALPVRRADLIKRIKMHRAKLLRILQACKFKLNQFEILKLHKLLHYV